MAFAAQIVSESCHTALRVRDLEATVQFYNQVVGLPTLRALGDPARPESVLMPGLQLVRAPEQDIANKGVLDHLALGVANLRALAAHLQASGVALEMPVTERKQPDGKSVLLAFFRDIEGNLVELVQRG